MKKMLALLTGLICLSAPLTEIAVPSAMVLSASAEEYEWNTNCSYIYDALSDDQKDVYNQLLDSCRQVDASSADYEKIPAVTTRKLDASEIISLSSIFVFDHPEFFWISPNYEIGSSGRTITYTMKLYSQYQNGETRQETKQQLISLEQEYLNQMSAYDSDYEKAEYLMKQLRQDITFGYGEDNIDQSIASALLNHQTVCAGYSKLYELLCNASGIDVMTEISLNHAWNVIHLEGNWYHVDVTYGLFLYSDSELHEFDESKGLYTTEVDGQEISFYMHEPYEAFYTFALPDTSQSYSKPLLAGDATGDGAVDILDVITINQTILGKDTLTEEQLKAIDFNGNGKPDSEEALIIMKYIVGLLASLTE
ncbi:MAG: hypothetical protein IJJ69_10840 [Oscillospiraceae bacterium]|nr:hypothetical protein [Oscillospiraceae bacterium]